MDDATDRWPPWSSAIPPAPGALRLVQAFVNSLDLERGLDQLASPEALSSWLTAWGLLEGDEGEVDEVARRQAVELREGLRALLTAHDGGAAHEAHRASLDGVLAALPLRLRLDAAGSFRLEAPGGGWPGAAAGLLTVVVGAMADGSWARLKTCRRRDCRWAFYDASKNRSGRWCSMEGCGNLMKARAYRRRRANG